jgi:hypothetical protein
MTMTIDEALKLDGTEFWKHPEIVGAVQEVLNPGPWNHVWRPSRITCARCNEPFVHVGVGRSCHVPPPLTEPHEVIVRRLRDYVLPGDGRQSLPGHAQAFTDDIREMLLAVHPNWSARDAAEEDAWLWYATTSPEQQAITCLLALGKLEVAR